MAIDWNKIRNNLSSSSTPVASKSKIDWNKIRTNLSIKDKPVLPTSKFEFTTPAQKRSLEAKDIMTGMIQSGQAQTSTPIIVPPRQKPSFLSRVGEYLAPKPRVRAIDVVREIPEALATVGNFIRTVQQEIVRSGASVALTMAGAPSGGAKELDISGDNIENKIAQVIFGDRPLQSIETRIANAELAVKDWGQKMEKSDKEWKKSVGKFSDENALGLSFVGVGGIIALDFTGAGGQKSAVKALAQSKDIGFISKLLRQIGVAEDIIPATASKISTIKDEKIILNALNKINDIQKSTKIIKEGIEEAMLNKIKPAGQGALELAPPGMGETNLFKQIEKTIPPVEKGGYGGDFNRNLDYARNSQVVKKSLDDAYKILEDIKKTGKVAIVDGKPRIKDFLKEGNPGGYHHIVVNVKAPNGHIAEIQITTPEMFNAKINSGDKLYDEWRVLDTKTRSIEEQKKWLELDREMHQLYADAWERDMKAFASDSEITSPSLSQELFLQGSQAPLDQIKVSAGDALISRPSQSINRGYLSSDINVSPSTTNVAQEAAKVKPAGKKTVAERIMGMKKFATEAIAEKATKAKAIIREKGIKEVPGFEAPEETIFRKLQKTLQDKMNRLDIIQREIKKSGKEISEKADAYLDQELFIGRASERINQFDKKVLDPILQKLKSTKIDADDFGAYLYAKHAGERNAQIAKLGKLESGSGMTGQQAENIIKEFEAKVGKKEADNLANEFYENITKKRLQVLKESELMDAESISKLEKTYKNYVPLKGKTGVERLDPMGQGFSLSGKDVKRAFGRESRAENPFVRAILDYQNTLIRAEKNKVAQTFLKLVEENPNPKLWTVEKLQYSPRFDKTGELISLDPKYKFADNVMEVKVDGKTKLITINDPALAKTMKNLGQEKSFKILQTTNNYLRAINTVINPEFVITNFERDLQTALINIGGEQSLKMAKNTAKNIPKAMKGIWKNIRKGDTTSEWSKIYQELKDEGGKTGFFDYKNVEQKTNELLKRIKSYNADTTTQKMSNAVKGVGEYILDANEVVEMAVRTSAYNEALINGFSKKQAASLAKNLTVNFNKKGNWGTALNTLYLFANASIQGSARILTALKYPKVRKIVAGVVGASFAINELNRSINEEEYKKITESEKNRNLIFMMPNGNHLDIKLPYGYNIFKILGDISNEIIHGDITPIEAGKRLLISLDDAYNPLSSATLSQLISPTLADPIVQLSENKNWFGGPIKPDQLPFGAKKRESSLYWSSVRPQTKAITEWLNKITGGSEIEAGFVDVSPEQIDHLFDFMTGGTGKFIANSLSTGINILQGDFPDLKNIPFVRQIIQKPSEFYEAGAIRDIRDKSGTKILSEKDLDKFRSALKTRVEKEEIEPKDALSLVKELLKNQARIKAGEVYTKIKNATAETKAEAISQLNSLEKEEFIKILKSKIK